MSCYSGQCLCGGGYFFSNSQSVCVQNCSHHDDSYLHYKDWDLHGYNANIFANVNASTCASFCNQRATCVLFSYVPGYGSCYLKEVTPQDFPGDWRARPGVDVYQRTCA
ncbi:hypothetical protein V1264_022476 [Littorina saxatilis]|uniref:Apple domain-containing protein n=1 Tax=Littorina saxatilis TaxID=31220 RepID=A0AAN9AKL8_9CAEN